MSNAIERSGALSPSPAWVGRRFQRRGLGFSKAFIVALPVSVILWIAAALFVAAV